MMFATPVSTNGYHFFAYRNQISNCEITLSLRHPNIQFMNIKFPLM